MTPGRLDFAHVSKHAAMVVAFYYEALDFSGGSLAMHVRAAPGMTGTPLVALGAAPAGSQGLSASYDPDVVDASGATVGATIVVARVDAATLSAIAWGQVPPDEPLTLAYDVLVTPVGGPAELAFLGLITLYPGVTIP